MLQIQVQFAHIFYLPYGKDTCKTGVNPANYILEFNFSFSASFASYVAYKKDS